MNSSTEKDETVPDRMCKWDDTIAFEEVDTGEKDKTTDR